MDFLQSLLEREEKWWKKTRRRKGRVPLPDLYLENIDPWVGMMDDGKILRVCSRMCPRVQFFLEDFCASKGLREIQREEGDPFEWLLRETTRDEEWVDLETYLLSRGIQKCS
jgi:hypothetical protein